MSALLKQLQRRQDAIDALRMQGNIGHPSLRRNFAWKSGGKYKLTDPGAKAESTSDSDLSATFVISTVAQDRDGDILLPEGCKPYLSAYERSPVVLYGHSTGLQGVGDPSFPVGLAKSADGKLLVEITDGEKITSTCRFHQETEAAVQCYALVKLGVLSMASVGFIPHLAERLKAHENESLEHEEIEFGYSGYLFKIWEMVEWSIVPIASNREAIRLSLDKGVDGRKLVPEIRKSLEPLAPPRLIWASGASLAPSQDLSAKSAAAVMLPKAKFKAISQAAKWLHQRSWDSSVVEDAGDSWRFIQPAALTVCDGPECRRDLGDGAYAVLISEGQTVEQKDGACGCRKGEDVKKRRKKEMEPIDQNKADEVQSEQEEQTKEPLGASVIRAIKALVEAAEPELDNAKVKRYCKWVLGKGKSVADMEYAGLDFGWKMEDHEEPDEEDEDEIDEDEDEIDEDEDDVEEVDDEDDIDGIDGDEDGEDDEEDDEDFVPKSAAFNELLRKACSVSRRLDKLTGKK